MDAAAPKRSSRASMLILIWADHVAVGVALSAVIVIATVVSGTGGCGADRGGNQSPVTRRQRPKQRNQAGDRNCGDA
jgi:hypothetical protein